MSHGKYRIMESKRSSLWFHPANWRLPCDKAHHDPERLPDTSSRPSSEQDAQWGPHTGQIPLYEAETAFSAFLNGRGSCGVPGHKTGVMPMPAA